ncbi:MAG: Xaa-Pro peptidase family protein [Syntrophobacteraceae bacterium]|nr:Xaa-Pro peptidase family protein [Syntrophobacteraceae bacterium]
MLKIPAEEIAGRLVSLQGLLAKNGVDVAIIRHNADLFYFTGTVQDAHLVVPAGGNPVLFVRRNLERAKEQTPLRPIVAMKSLSELAGAVSAASQTREPGVIGLTLDVMPANLFFMFDEKLFPKQTIRDISPLVRMVRSIKSAWEIEQMRNAAKVGDLVKAAVVDFLREGVSELELDAELEAVARKAGNMGLYRVRTYNNEMGFGHILSGAEGAIPAYHDAPTGGPGLCSAFGQGGGIRKIGRNEVVSVDNLVCVNGYHNDSTRNFCIGRPPQRLAEAYDFIKSVHVRFRELARPGSVAGELYQTVVRWAEDGGWGKWFMGHAEPRISFVAHGIGVEVDEFPFIAKGQKMALEEGMIFAFEPKIVIPGVGLVGIENTYLVNSAGIESLNIASEELIIL